ncbi:MAG TPA: TIGR01212 family radical SAM protein [Clostridiales bacterium]|jgi:radical SAM protein (TIGR01212 family)|nr:TIGR01212 family radical SAM protein [Clostridiales bacterium]
MNQRLYYKYSDYLKDKYKEKVYKVPVNVNTTCPNRDGNIGYGGCIFCGEEGAGFELLDKENSIKNQISKNKKFISKRYKAEKFIIYFQNFTNTYINFKVFKTNILESIDSDVVEIAVSTRPDCITDEILTFLKEIKDKNKINIKFELGLQTCNYKSLKKLNRGHTLAEYIYTANRIKNIGFDLCTHIILNLPWDEVDDAVENAKIVSSIKTDTVKIHSLYILKDTILGKMYEEEKISIIDKDEYIERMILFLEYLNPEIGIQRLFSRAPKERTLFCNWDTSWWKLKDDLINKMNEKRSFQGKKYNYLIPKVKK